MPTAGSTTQTKSTAAKTRLHSGAEGVTRNGATSAASPVTAAKAKVSATAAPRRRGRTANPAQPATPKTNPAKPQPTAPAKAEASTADQKPNLVYLLMNGTGEFRVHAVGCPQAKTDAKKSDYAEPYPMFAETRRAAVLDLYDDQIAEQYPGRDEDSLTDDELGVYDATVGFHKCVKFDQPEAPGLVVPKTAKREAKQQLAKLAVRALDDLARSLDTEGSPEVVTVLAGMSREDAAKCLSQWIHHFPTNGEWPAETLPKPDRSNWR